MRGLGRRLLRLATSLVVLGVVLGAWKLYVVHQDVSRFVLPPPDDVAVATWDLLFEERTWTNTRITLTEIVGGFALATLAGVVVGALLAELPRLDRAVTPYLVAFQVLPKVALIPLFVVWFGFGLSSKLFIAGLFAFFPIMVGTRNGIRSVDPGHHDLLATLRAGRWQRVRMVHLPSALPAILTGMEVGMVLATIGAVTAEFLSGNDEGLAWQATVHQSSLQIDTMFGVIVLLSLLGYVLHALVAALRRRLVPWHPSATTPTGL